MDVCLKWPLFLVGTLSAMYDLWIGCIIESNGIDQLHYVNSSSYLQLHCDANGMVCTCEFWVTVSCYPKLEHCYLQFKTFTACGTQQGMVFGTSFGNQLFYNE